MYWKKKKWPGLVSVMCSPSLNKQNVMDVYKITKSWKLLLFLITIQSEHFVFFLVSDGAGCKAGFTAFQNSCYFVNNEPFSRSEAESACIINQTHLTDITSAGEQEFVVELLKESGGNDAWLGLTLLDDSLSWFDGSLLSNGSWYNIESTGNIICYHLQYRGTKGYIWNNALECESNLTFICEYKGIW